MSKIILIGKTERSNFVIGEGNTDLEAAIKFLRSLKRWKNDKLVTLKRSVRGRKKRQDIFGTSFHRNLFFKAIFEESTEEEKKVNKEEEEILSKEIGIIHEDGSRELITLGELEERYKNR